ncbi:hypothetical protein IWW45_009433, partial [Coemansia sp. RSA 485]
MHPYCLLFSFGEFDGSGEYELNCSQSVDSSVVDNNNKNNNNRGTPTNGGSRSTEAVYKETDIPTNTQLPIGNKGFMLKSKNTLNSQSPQKKPLRKDN